MPTGSEIVRFARTLSRVQFVERFRGRYLWVSTDPRELPVANFQTVPGRSKDGPAGGPSSADAILPIVKVPGHPYPDRISVGRTGNCDIVLRDGSVSKLHAHFQWDDEGDLELTDQRSSNGTLVNGIAILPGCPESVGPGDVVQFGNVRAAVLDGAGVYDALQRAV